MVGHPFYSGNRKGWQGFPTTHERTCAHHGTEAQDNVSIMLTSIMFNEDFLNLFTHDPFHLRNLYMTVEF